MFANRFIDRLLLLEEKTGADVHYGLMPPMSIACYDCIALQTAAKQIAAFIGLREYTFLIATGDLGAHVAGDIELCPQQSEVFIQIGDNLLESPPAVAATLCHEISHKWLQVHGIKSPMAADIDNEILTDITCVYLGLGKIMLNGCMTTSTRHEKTDDGTCAHTTTRRVGYLKIDQLAFVYRMVCAMRRIPPAAATEGLSSDAVRALKNCDADWGHYYDAKHHDAGVVREHEYDLEACALEAQRQLAAIQKLTVYAKKSYCGTLDDFVSAGHKMLDAHRGHVGESSLRASHDPAIRFLGSVRSSCNMARFETEVRALRVRAEEMHARADSVARRICHPAGEFPPPQSAMFSIVTCPRDGTTLKLPENSGEVVVKCPHCGYRFAYNTNVLSLPAHDEQARGARVVKPRRPRRWPWS
jgi:hypothetical protein